MNTNNRNKVQSDQNMHVSKMIAIQLFPFRKILIIVMEKDGLCCLIFHMVSKNDSLKNTWNVSAKHANTWTLVCQGQDHKDVRDSKAK